MQHIVAQALYQPVSGLFQLCFNVIETSQPIDGIRFTVAKTSLFHVFLEKSISASKNAKCGNACT